MHPSWSDGELSIAPGVAGLGLGDSCQSCMCLKLRELQGLCQPVPEDASSCLLPKAEEQPPLSSSASAGPWGCLGKPRGSSVEWILAAACRAHTFILRACVHEPARLCVPALPFSPRRLRPSYSIPWLSSCDGHGGDCGSVRDRQKTGWSEPLVSLLKAKVDLLLVLARSWFYPCPVLVAEDSG